MKRLLNIRSGSAAAILLAAALPACSADNYESMGTITASIGGQSYNGITLAQTSRHDSSATFRLMGGMTLIVIQGHDPGAGSMTENVISLEASLMGADASSSAYEVKLLYWPEGMSGPFYTNDQTGHEVSLVWDTLSLAGEATASGSFETTVCYQAGYFSEVDVSNCMDVTGRFETELDRREL